jgi:hypothetical protein
MPPSFQARAVPHLHARQVVHRLDDFVDLRRLTTAASTRGAIAVHGQPASRDRGRHGRASISPAGDRLSVASSRPTRAIADCS